MAAFSTDGPNNRMLRPVSTILLPPGGTLAPPGNSAVTGGLSTTGEMDPLLDSLGAGLTRAAATGRVFAERARSTAAEHAPEMRRRAAQAADIAGQTALTAANLAATKAAAAREAWRTTGAKPGARRRLVLGVGAGLIAVLALVWVVAQQHATSVARVQAPLLLARAGLSGVVSYRDVSASPFGTLTLNGVTVRAGRDIIPIASATVRGSGLQHAAIALRGAAIPVRLLVGMVPYRLPSLLLGLGYVVPSIDGDVDFAVDDASQRLSATARLRAAGMGRVEAKLRIGGVTLAQLNQIGAVMASRSNFQPGMEPPLVVQSMLQDLLNWSLQSASISIDDAPLVARASLVPAKPMPSDKTATSDDRMGEEISRSLAQLVPPDRSDATQHLVAAWLRDGGALVLRADPVTPVSLFRAGNFLEPIVPALSDPAILAQANITISD